MEDLKRRLEMGNPFIQEQGVWRLYAEIEKKKPHGKITSETPEIAELKWLWDTLSGEKPLPAQTAADVLLQLVLCDVTDFTYVINGVLNRVPSARCLGGVVSALGQLLVLEALAIEDTHGKYTCPHELRAPTHPFITVLTHRPASWPLLMSQVERIALHEEMRVQRMSVEMLRPFLTFVLLDPSPSHPSPSLMRQQLQHLLLDLCSQAAARESWLNLLLTALPAYQVNTAEATYLLTTHVRQLLRVVSACQQQQGQGQGSEGKGQVSPELRQVVRVGLSLVRPGSRHQLDMGDLVHSLLQSVQDSPLCLAGDADLARLSLVLLELGPCCPRTLMLRLVERVISAQQPATCSAVGAAILLLPLLQFMSAAPPGLSRASSASASYRQMTSAVSSSLGVLEELVREAKGRGSDKEQPEVVNTARHLFGNEVQTESLSHLLSNVTAHQHTTLVWLQHLKKHLADIKESEHVSWEVTSVVSAVLLVYPSTAVTSLALDILVHIARLDNAKAPCFVPVLLYCLGREGDPESHLLLLEHLPQLAVHKLCVGPILKTVQALMTSPRLRPVALRLMTSLWQQQDRCFPHLLKAIGTEEGKEGRDASAEVLLAKAAAIKEICRLKPEQHGAELLSPLSKILETAKDAEGAPASALALEGVYHLCEAEVIDIQSTWEVLSKYLEADDRAVVVVKICDLFSLVPGLATITPQYEAFQAGVVSKLWRYTQSNQPLVQGAAFQALASFAAESFRVSHLPPKVCEELHKQVALVHEQQSQMEAQGAKVSSSEVTVDTLFSYVPGVSYTRLLKSLPEPVLDDYEAFLSSLVGREVEGVPRGVQHAASRHRGPGGSQDKALHALPAFLTQLHRATKQPGLRPSLAASLLFCFDPPVEVGRDGRPRKHYLVRHGKLYTDMFKSLVNEVPVQPSEWHRSLLMPQAWVSFVHRMCLALIESRTAELDLQFKNGQISEDQREEKTLTAWLFVRDTIVDILKAASRCNPSQQANSILVLAALVSFTDSHARQLEPAVLKECEAASEHLSHAHWTAAALDTILSFRDVKHRPRAQLLGFAQQRSAQDRTAVSTLAQSAACLCLAPLVPCLLTTHADVIARMTRDMTTALPGGRKASEVPALQFHNGLGLGMMLGRLFEEHFTDMADKQAVMAVWQAMKALEECCWDPAHENRAGCVLGLSLALIGLCQEAQADSRQHVLTVWQKLGQLLDATSPEDPAFQALCFCLSCVSGCASTADILSVAQVNASLHQLEMTHAQHPQVSGSSLGLGMLCYTLSKLGHPGVGDLRQSLTSQWLTSLTSPDAAPMEKIAALNGLMALIGSEQTLVVVQAGVSLTSSDVKVSEVIEVATNIVKSDPDLGIQCNAAWMLGHLHLSACAVADTRASVPPNYGYLPEASFLRAIVDLLIEAGKQGPEGISSRHLKVALVSLQDDVKRVLPPLNWAAVLSPLVRLPFGEECRRACLTLALSQGASSSTAAMFLASWLTPPLSATLDSETKKSLFLALPKIMKSVPVSVLSTFLERSCVPAFLPESLDPDLAVCVLQGLTDALRVGDPPEAVTTLLYATAGKLYSLMPESFHPSLYRGMAECLSHVPDHIFDNVTLEDYSSGTCKLRGLFIGCYLVTKGNQPITLLNSLIDSAMNSPHCGGDSALYVLCTCLWRLTRLNTETGGPMARLHWLLELLGHTRNVLTGVMPLSSASQQLGTVVEFCVVLVAMATNLLTAARPSPNFALDPDLLNPSTKDDVNVRSKGSGPKQPVPDWTRELTDTFVAQLPMAVQSFESTPWDQLLPKIYDWLWTVRGLPGDALRPELKERITAALLMLRHCSEFRKPANWTQVFTTGILF